MIQIAIPLRPRRRQRRNRFIAHEMAICRTRSHNRRFRRRQRRLALRARTFKCRVAIGLHIRRPLNRRVDVAVAVLRERLALIASATTATTAKISAVASASTAALTTASAIATTSAATAPASLAVSPLIIAPIRNRRFVNAIARTGAIFEVVKSINA
jgi:hypothetical protein